MRMTKLLVSAAALGALVLSGACKKDDEKKVDKPNPCADKNPCAGKTPANPCAGKTVDNPCNPCNPCGGDGDVDPKALFSRLGGKEAITAVVDDFVANVVADDRINKFFAKADAVKLKGHLVAQICMATGGPCKYEGKDMKTAHAGMGISDGDFTALVEDLTKALEKHAVPEAEKTELLNALAGMKGDIVEAK